MIKTLIDLMVQAIDNCDEHQDSAECRYMTLLEILSSFTDNWEMSSFCRRIWGSVEVPNLDVDIESPNGFRRTAYGVLMNLTWVPNSPGLRALCFDAESDSVIQEVP